MTCSNATPPWLIDDVEQRMWVAMLGKTRDGQIRVLSELLHYANADEMSPKDRAICRAQLHRLQHEKSGWRQSARKR